jgi:hypothetical protein
MDLKKWAEGGSGDSDSKLKTNAKFPPGTKVKYGPRMKMAGARPRKGVVSAEPTDLDPTRFVKVRWDDGETEAVSIAAIVKA